MLYSTTTTPIRIILQASETVWENMCNTKRTHPYTCDASWVVGIATGGGGIRVADEAAKAREVWYMWCEQTLHKRAHRAVPQRCESVEGRCPR